MTNKVHNFIRLGGIALAGFALLAAGELPQFEANTPVADAPVASLAPVIAADTDSLHGDEASAPSVEPVRPASLHKLVADIAALPATPLDTEAKCLARAVFFEARGEPLEGQLAVAQVIVNRTNSGKYPKSVCGVVDQPRQFTFARRSINTGSADYRTAQAIAVIAQAERWLQVAPRAMAFHAKHVSPGWGGMERVRSIGNHVFYR